MYNSPRASVRRVSDSRKLSVGSVRVPDDTGRPVAIDAPFHHRARGRRGVAAARRADRDLCERARREELICRSSGSVHLTITGPKSARTKAVTARRAPPPERAWSGWRCAHDNLLWMRCAGLALRRHDAEYGDAPTARLAGPEWPLASGEQEEGDAHRSHGSIAPNQCHLFLRAVALFGWGRSLEAPQKVVLLVLTSLRRRRHLALGNDLVEGNRLVRLQVDERAASAVVGHERLRAAGRRLLTRARGAQQRQQHHPDDTHPASLVPVRRAPQPPHRAASGVPA